MFVENNKFMLEKYAFQPCFQRHFPPRFVYTFCLSIYTWLSLRLSYTRDLLRNDLMENVFSSKNCEQTRKVEGNKSDRMSRIMNVLQSLWRETFFVDVAMGYSRAFSRHFRMNMISFLPISKNAYSAPCVYVLTFPFLMAIQSLFISLGLRCGKVKEENT